MHCSCSVRYYGLLVKVFKLLKTICRWCAFYRPQGKVIFSKLSLCSRVGGGGGGGWSGGLPISAYWGGICLLGGLPTRGEGVCPLGVSVWGISLWGFSVQGGLHLGGVSIQAGRRPPPQHWQPQQQSVCILLECILVLKKFFSEMTNAERFQGHNSYSVMICSDNFNLWAINDIKYIKNNEIALTLCLSNKKLHLSYILMYDTPTQ